MPRARDRVARVPHKLQAHSVHPLTVLRVRTVRGSGASVRHRTAWAPTQLPSNYPLRYLYVGARASFHSRATHPVSTRQ
eukprot:scaffold64916_cov58-Phaeocystis_antarctica.AAC.1